MLDPWLAFAIAVAVCVFVAVAVTALVTLLIRLLARRQEWPSQLVTRARAPFRVLVLTIALWIAVTAFFPERTWLPGITQAFVILIIAGAAWLLIATIQFVTDLALGRYRIDVPNNRVARRIRTQALIVRRLAIAVIVVLAIGAALLTFPAVRTLGASVLASAGIASIVAGLAAQSVLANMFAGVQLVFSDALRVDDVIVAEGEWGRVGEITLSYVVLDLWDDRRLVLPCTYFTTQPFQNWTRKGSELLGAVELDLDWRVSLSRMRSHLDEVVAASTRWDGRAAVLQVTDATGGMIRVRILVTAADAPTLFDLRCEVREEMLTWVQRTFPAGLPVQRIMMTSEDATLADDAHEHEAAGLFSGNAEAEQRAASFTQSVPVVAGDDADDEPADANAQRSVG